MRYVYAAAWAVVGGILPPQGSAPIELARLRQARFVLTRDPNDAFAKVDEGHAIRRLMLKGLTGQRGATDFPTALAAEVDEIRAERTKRIGGKAVLLIEAQGDVEAKLTEPMREHDNFIVTFDAVDGHQVRALHQTDIDGMKAAIAFESDAPSRFTDLTEGVYLLNDAGKVIHSASFSGSADGYQSVALTEEGVARISNRYAALTAAPDLDSVERLFSQMSEYGIAPLKAFVSGWAAFEILIAKSFKNYEQAFLAPFTNAEQPSLRERFLGRIKGVMKDNVSYGQRANTGPASIRPSIRRF